MGRPYNDNKERSLLRPYDSIDISVRTSTAPTRKEFQWLSHRNRFA